MSNELFTNFRTIAKKPKDDENCFVNCKSIDFLEHHMIRCIIICGLDALRCIFELRKNEKKGVKFMRFIVIL